MIVLILQISLLTEFSGAFLHQLIHCNDDLVIDNYSVLTDLETNVSSYFLVLVFQQKDWLSGLLFGPSYCYRRRILLVTRTIHSRLLSKLFDSRIQVLLRQEVLRKTERQCSIYMINEIILPMMWFGLMLSVVNAPSCSWSVNLSCWSICGLSKLFTFTCCILFPVSACVTIGITPEITIITASDIDRILRLFV